MCKISIIVPVYKVESYLSRCIESILCQSFKDFELILVDDGSPDKCGDICDEYAKKDSRIRVIHKENGGVSSARNKGLEVAKGEYIAFCDSDDYIAVDWLEELYSAAIKYSADSVVAGYTEIDGNGVPKKTVAPQNGQWQFQTMEERLEYLLTDVLQKDNKNHGWEIWRRLFRSSIIRDEHICFCTTCGNYAEDQAFVLEFGLYASNVVALDNNGYRYVVRSDSMMNTTAMRMKLNEANEVSVYFGKVFYDYVTDNKWRKQYSLFHYLILYQEYQKTVYSEQFPELGKAVKAIRNQNWYRINTRNLMKCKKDIVKRYGVKNAYRIFLLSRYCLHGNWTRYSFESAIVYRWFLKNN